MKQNPLLAWKAKNTFNPYFNWMYMQIKSSKTGQAIYESLDSAIPVEWIHNAVKKGLLELSKTWSLEENTFFKEHTSAFVLGFNDWLKFATPKIATQYFHSDEEWKLLCLRAKSLKKDTERSTAWLLFRVLQYTHDQDNEIWPLLLRKCYSLWEYKYPAFNTISDSNLTRFLTSSLAETGPEVRMALAVHCWVEGRTTMLTHPIFENISKDQIYENVLKKAKQCLLLLPTKDSDFEHMQNQLHLMLLIRAEYKNNTDPDDNQRILEFEQKLSDFNMGLYHILPETDGRLFHKHVQEKIKEQWLLIDHCTQPQATPIDLSNISL